MAAVYPPTTPALLTFPQTTLAHYVGSSSFPLASGPCSLIELDSEDASALGSGAEAKTIALSIPPNTTVVLGKDNLVRKTDQNEAHATYSFGFSPTPKSSSQASSSKSELPTSNSQGGYLKLTLPSAKNQQQHDDLSQLARQFEAILQSHNLLDTRLPEDAEEDADETIAHVLSSWWNGSIAGVKQTAGVVYQGVGELAGGVQQEIEQKGAMNYIRSLVPGGDKGKGKAPAEFQDVTLTTSPKLPSAPLAPSTPASRVDATHHADAAV